jgi:GNAT acetyltransferase-like protein
MLRHGFVDVDSPHWERALSGINHDFYHLPGYVRLCSRHERGKPVVFLAEQGECRLLIPLLIRPIDPAIATERNILYDASSPYGYPCPLLSLSDHDDSENFLRLGLAAFLDGLRERRIVSAFVRLHPLIDLPEGPLTDVGFLVTHGETVSIDLTLPREEIWHQTRQDHRSNINKLERLGVSVRIDKSLTLMSEFRTVYLESMKRVEADNYYNFPLEYFTELSDVLGDRLHLCVVEIDGQLASGALFVESCGTVQYHLSGTMDAFLKLHPSKTILNFVRYWAKDRGNRVLHLGGGLGGRKDALFDFKAGFSKIRHPFKTWRIIADQDRYQRLTANWRAISRVEADVPEGFFPAYRKVF